MNIIKMNEKEFDKIIKKIKKSKFQNCCNCSFFPKFNASLSNFEVVIHRWYWQIENIKCIDFRCTYLRKRVSQSIEPFKSNCCLCYHEGNNK